MFFGCLFSEQNVEIFLSAQQIFFFGITFWNANSKLAYDVHAARYENNPLQESFMVNLSL